MKARALARDFGRTGCWILVALICVMAFGSAISPIRARNTYLTLATFHAWLELAVLAFFLPQRAAKHESTPMGSQRRRRMRETSSTIAAAKPVVR